MNTETQVPRKHKRYDEFFKRAAVELWLQGGKSLQQIAAWSAKRLSGGKKQSMRGARTRPFIFRRDCACLSPGRSIVIARPVCMPPQRAMSRRPAGPGVNGPAHREHVWVGVARRRDVLKLVVGIPPVAKQERALRRVEVAMVGGGRGVHLAPTRPLEAIRVGTCNRQLPTFL